VYSIDLPFFVSRINIYLGTTLQSGFISPSLRGLQTYNSRGRFSLLGLRVDVQHRFALKVFTTNVPQLSLPKDYGPCVRELVSLKLSTHSRAQLRSFTRATNAKLWRCSRHHLIVEPKVFFSRFLSRGTISSLSFLSFFGKSNCLHSLPYWTEQSLLQPTAFHVLCLDSRI
jgi:hypothetical protein